MKTFLMQKVFVNNYGKISILKFFSICGFQSSCLWTSLLPKRNKGVLKRLTKKTLLSLRLSPKSSFTFSKLRFWSLKPKNRKEGDPFLLFGRPLLGYNIYNYSSSNCFRNSSISSSKPLSRSSLRIIVSSSMMSKSTIDCWSSSVSTKE